MFVSLMSEGVFIVGFRWKSYVGNNCVSMGVRVGVVSSLVCEGVCG